jgi:UDP-N-acetylglucosamine--N-acetylmuramyl-(pentapeptide) pyrophosphoryl-undecaprenol N-acetylglucosamine transferase
MTHYPRTVIVLAAGGTGGHMFPAEALARELAARGFALALVTDRRGAAFGEGAGVEVHRIHAGQVIGNVFRKIAAVVQLGRGLLEARRLLRDLDPAIAIGFGGYASLPTMLAAVHSSVLTVIHEQNAVLGRANRMLASRVDAIATSFDQVLRLPRSGRAIMRRTGNPVRPEIAALSRRPYPAPEADGPLQILITGGSQGATIFSSIVPLAVASLPPELRSRLRLVQQCRAADLEGVTQAYRELGVAAELRPFFADMPEQLARSQLVIGRAGASTVAEITAAGRPAILVPYPAAMDDHQTANARALLRQRCAWLVHQPEFTPEKLRDMLGALLAEPARLVDAARRSREAGIPNAAAQLADMVAGLVSDGGTRARSHGAGPREAAE